MINEQRLLDEFLELVQIGSESGHEKAIGEVLVKKLEALGLQVEKMLPTTGYQTDGFVVFARLPGNLPGSEPIMVSSHMDTVAPGFGVKPQIRDGAIYTDGTTVLGGDNKAGIAEILEAVRTILENNAPHREVEIVFSIGEEVGLQGAKSVDVSKLHSKRAYILDCGTNIGKMVIKAPASTTMTFEITGRTAHAGSCPEKGISAIQAAAKGIAQMNLLRVNEETTCNIGTIRSEFPNNIVPEHCYVSAAARSLDPAKLQAQIDHMVSCMQSACDELGATLECRIDKVYDNFDIPMDSPVVQELVGAMEELGIEPRPASGLGGWDANVYNARGIVALPTSCGMRSIHTTKEYIKIADLNQASELMYAMMTR